MLLASELSIWLVLVILYGSHLEIQDGHLLHHTFFLKLTITFLAQNIEDIAAQIGKY